jgi:TetR/AcrR family transcriptional regulator, transcriptional repressor for nem operon
MHPTKKQLIEVGLPLLLQRGYNDLGIQTLLAATGVPRGSFYHHFKDKEDFALQVVDAYVARVSADLDAALSDPDLPPLGRVRRFFDLTQEQYRRQGYMGCLLGGLGQELSGVSEVFRRKIEGCFSGISGRMAGCLEEARERGDIPAGSDTRRMADLLVDCWEGAALRSRMRQDPASLDAMLDFFIGSVAAGGGGPPDVDIRQGS